MALPTEVATGFWATAEQTLANAIADCPATWTFLSVSNATGARAGNMFIDVLERPTDAEGYSVKVDSVSGESEWSGLHPYILLGTPGDEAGAVHLFRRSSPDDFGCRGLVQVVFAALPDLRQTTANQQRIFKDQIANILKDLTDRGDIAGFLHFSEIEVQGYYRERPDMSEDVGEVQYVVCFIPWGDVTEE